MRLLDTSGGGSSLTGGLGGELLTRGLATSGLTWMDVSDDDSRRDITLGGTRP